mmetsp:Transcript_110278/g.235531  ORF Transcript_110278/g.235531 Transcript_110278/m.235531 type:complete len:261 (+) Transcript_110278:2125-2907(+)
MRLANGRRPAALGPLYSARVALEPPEAAPRAPHWCGQLRAGSAQLLPLHRGAALCSVERHWRHGPLSAIAQGADLGLWLLERVRSSCTGQRRSEGSGQGEGRRREGGAAAALLAARGRSTGLALGALVRRRAKGGVGARRCFAPTPRRFAGAHAPGHQPREDGRGPHRHRGHPVLEALETGRRPRDGIVGSGRLLALHRVALPFSGAGTAARLAALPLHLRLSRARRSPVVAEDDVARCERLHRHLGVMGALWPDLACHQ